MCVVSSTIHAFFSVFDIDEYLSYVILGILTLEQFFKYNLRTLRILNISYLYIVIIILFPRKNRKLYLFARQATKPRKINVLYN